MKIDNNTVEMEAMAAFRKGDGAEGHRLQDKCFCFNVIA